MNLKTVKTLVIASAVSIAAATGALAFPDKSVEYIIPFGPGVSPIYRLASSNRFSRTSSVRILWCPTSPAAAARSVGRSSIR